MHSPGFGRPNRAFQADAVTLHAPDLHRVIQPIRDPQRQPQRQAEHADRRAGEQQPRGGSAQVRHRPIDRPPERARAPRKGGEGGHQEQIRRSDGQQRDGDPGPGQEEEHPGQDPGAQGKSQTQRFRGRPGPAEAQQHGRAEHRKGHYQAKILESCDRHSWLARRLGSRGLVE